MVRSDEELPEDCEVSRPEQEEKPAQDILNENVPETSQ